MIKLPENLPSPIGLNKSELLDILQTEIYGRIPSKPVSVSASERARDKSFCVAASEYYKADGRIGFVHPDRMPEIGDAFHEGDIGYHLRDGKHYFSREDWVRYIEFLEK